MTHKDKESTSNARKVWIFKMLLTKHGCKVRLDKDFRFASSGQKIEFFRVILDMQNGKTCILTVMTKHGLALIEIPYKYNISYADVLDSILDAMKKTKSDCELRSINRLFYNWYITKCKCSNFANYWNMFKKTIKSTDKFCFKGFKIFQSKEQIFKGKENIKRIKALSRKCKICKEK